MGRGISNGLLNNLEAAADGLADNRREGFDLKHKLIDALKSALSVFFFQHPSMLGFQIAMKQKWKRCNLETVMGVKELPSNLQITTLLDGIDPDSLSSVFNKNLHAAEEHKWLSPPLLGDDLYSNYPFCKEALERGYSFIFTCKEDSHPWLAETVESSFPKETSRREWNGRYHLAYAYRRLDGLEIRDNKETIMANYFSLSIWNEEKNKQTFYNS